MRDWLRRTVHQDLRYAIRGLIRSPGFTVTVVLTLALGIGANAAMFGVIDRLMVRPFPYLRDPSTVDRMYLETTIDGHTNARSGIEYPRYLDLRRWSTTFSEFAAFTEWRLAIGPGDAARERQVAGVSASFFRFFDARPVIGRFFDAAEDSIPRGADVVVLSHGFWKTEFGARNVLGQHLQVGPLTLTIIGVAPEGFVGVSEAEPPAVFLPITTIAYGMNQGDAETFSTKYNWTWMSAMARRKPGVSREAASAELTRAYILSRDAQRLQNPRVLPVNLAHPRGIAGPLKTAAGPGAGLEARTLLWVSGVAAIVFLIACANVANLMVARVLRRRREIAVRLALGASRRRLSTQFLIEALLLAVVGCGAGITIAQWISAALRQWLIHDGVSTGLATDWRTIAAASAVALLAAILTSIGPALLAVRHDLTISLRAGARGGTHQRSRIRSGLLVVQASLSVILLIGAGLFVRSLGKARAARLGWDPEPVLIVTPNYRGFPMDSAARDAFRRRLLETAQSLPGVRFAARVNSLPFGTNTYSLHVPGIDSVERLGRFNYQSTSPDYFRAVDTRIVRGRSLMPQDRADAPPVTVVSESMARALWPGRDPIGQCIYVGRAPAPCTTVVGVAEDAVQNSITDTARLMYYLSDDQPPQTPANRLFLRMASADVATRAEGVRRALQQIMPGAAYVTVSNLEDLVDNQRRSWRLGAMMFVAFGGLALLVAAVGLYGVIAYDVVQRMHELGVRIALGAQARDIVRLVMSQGFAFAGAGVAIGTGVALLAARWMQPLLYEESARDPVVFTAVGATIAAVAVVASGMPAFRATRADPNAALRSD